MKRRIGYAVVGSGVVLLLGSCILRGPSSIIVNGYYIEKWRLGAFAGVVLLALGALRLLMPDNWR